MRLQWSGLLRGQHVVHGGYGGERAIHDRYHGHETTGVKPFPRCVCKLQGDCCDGISVCWLQSQAASQSKLPVFDSFHPDCRGSGVAPTPARVIVRESHLLFHHLPRRSFALTSSRRRRVTAPAWIDNQDGPPDSPAPKRPRAHPGSHARHHGMLGGLVVGRCGRRAVRAPPPEVRCGRKRPAPASALRPPARR
jgi:hypothetical protein